jgi:hypothetical protein
MELSRLLPDGASDGATADFRVYDGVRWRFRVDEPLQVIGKGLELLGDSTGWDVADTGGTLTQMTSKAVTAARYQPASIRA